MWRKLGPFPIVSSCRPLGTLEKVRVMYPFCQIFGPRDCRVEVATCDFLFRWALGTLEMAGVP